MDDVDDAIQRLFMDDVDDAIQRNNRLLLHHMGDVDTNSLDVDVLDSVHSVYTCIDV